MLLTITTTYQPARDLGFLPGWLELDRLPERLCHERNRGRQNRAFGSHVVRQQRSQLRQSLRKLGREGFRHVRPDDTRRDAFSERWNGGRMGSATFLL